MRYIHMERKSILYMKTLWVLMLMVSPCAAEAQGETPSIRPTAVYTTIDGEQEESTQFSGSAPLKGSFTANPENEGGWSATYEWRFRLEGEEEDYLTRYEQDTEYTFTQAGSHSIRLYATFVQGNDTVSYTDEYWAGQEPLRVTISESSLKMPNAFSPNGDERNDIYKAKKGWQSLVEFKATIYNRWGQKLFEWTDPNEGWDGTYHGHPVKEGVYFVVVNAKGADGVDYHIRRDVNLLRGYTETENMTGN